MSVVAIHGNEGMDEHDQLVWAVGRIQELEGALRHIRDLGEGRKAVLLAIAALEGGEAT